MLNINKCIFARNLTNYIKIGGDLFLYNLTSKCFNYNIKKTHLSQ